MDYFYAIISLLAGVGVFMVGFKILSENIEKLANKGLRKLFSKSANNPIAGVGIGAVATALINSSSATTVMIVGFVNAGIMSLFQATAIIMGANIGTTITTQFFALNDLGIDIVLVITIFAFIGVFMNMLSKKDKTRTLGMAFAGLGMVFLGLKYMSNSMDIFKESAAIVDTFSRINNPVVLLLIGTLVTALIQSSAAVAGIMIAMVGQGITIGSGGNAILFVILGTNIGTCITAILSSFGANTNARRASLIHLMFNVFGSALFFIILVIWRGFMDDTFVRLFSNPQRQIAMFHTFFNVTCTLLFIPFIKYFVKLSELLIKEKNEEDKKITVLDERLATSPALAMPQVITAIKQMGDLSMESLDLSIKGFLSADDEYIGSINNMITDVSKMNKEIVDYLVLISANDPSYEDEILISSIHHTISDLMRISEVADNVIKYTLHYINDQLEFSDAVLVSINEMYANVRKLYNYTIESFSKNDKTMLKGIDEIEAKIDKMREELINSHINRLNEGKCKAANSGVFINLVSNLERVGDHLTYIAHSIEK